MIGSGQPQSSQTGAASRQVHSPLAQAGSFNRWPTSARNDWPKSSESADYDPETGQFTWKPRPETHRGAAIFKSRYAGTKAGCPDHYGYIQLTVDGHNYKAHRLAWLWVHGAFPPADKEVDHRDRNRANNAIGNLRLATRQQQARNTGVRKPGHHKGCYWSPRDRKWSAWIYLDGRKVSLEAFKRLEDAKAARFQAETKHHGEWAYTAEPERRAA
jgi:hypothetical protein